MPAVNGVGKPLAGEPLGRFDGRELETEHPGHGRGEEQPSGKPLGSNGSETYRQDTPPRQLSTLLVGPPSYRGLRFFRAPHQVRRAEPKTTQRPLINQMMAATFFLVGLDNAYRLLRWCCSQHVDWDNTGQSARTSRGSAAGRDRHPRTPSRDLLTRADPLHPEPVSIGVDELRQRGGRGSLSLPKSAGQLQNSFARRGSRNPATPALIP
jgi:hypothetical protein